MPNNGDRDFTIIVTFSPDQARAVVALAGEVDVDAWPEMADTIHRLTAAAPNAVTVDVAAVSYAGSVLPNFLAHVRQTLPAQSALTVSRPTRWTRFVLYATDMAQIAKIEDALPA
jgi:anti-anti-sigma regulatory factor